MHSDGKNGYPEEAPYDRVIVTASATEVPKPLIDQLKSNGKMVIPVGTEMFLVTKDGKKTFLGNYIFVPLLGEKEWI